MKSVTTAFLLKLATTDLEGLTEEDILIEIKNLPDCKCKELEKDMSIMSKGAKDAVRVGMGICSKYRTALEQIKDFRAPYTHPLIMKQIAIKALEEEE